MHLYFPTSIFLAIALTLTVAGCGKSNENQSLVYGVISVDGQPLDNGEIRFTPIDGTAAPVSGASIQQGAYLAEGRGGVFAGKYRVSILGFRAPQSSATLDPDKMLPAVQFIPPRYNEKSDLIVEIPGGGRRFEANFEVEL